MNQLWVHGIDTLLAMLTAYLLVALMLPISLREDQIHEVRSLLHPRSLCRSLHLHKSKPECSLGCCHPTTEIYVFRVGTQNSRTSCSCFCLAQRRSF